MIVTDWLPQMFVTDWLPQMITTDWLPQDKFLQLISTGQESQTDTGTRYLHPDKEFSNQEYYLEQDK